MERVLPWVYLLTLVRRTTPRAGRAAMKLQQTSGSVAHRSPKEGADRGVVAGVGELGDIG